MGLTKCRDCGSMLSRKARACPQCGRPGRGSSGLFGAAGFLFSVVVIGAAGLALLPSKTETEAVTPEPRPAIPEDGGRAAGFDAGYRIGAGMGRTWAAAGTKPLLAEIEATAQQSAAQLGVTDREAFQRGFKAGFKAEFKAQLEW